jgi:hypothetical protein
MDPGQQVVYERDLEDDWYLLGGHRHPDYMEEARDAMATAELREWLEKREAPDGTYTVQVIELNPSTGQLGRHWARTRLVFRGAQKPNMQGTAA